MHDFEEVTENSKNPIYQNEEHLTRKIIFDLCIDWWERGGNTKNTKLAR